MNSLGCLGKKMYELGIVPVQCTSYRIFGGKNNGYGIFRADITRYQVGKVITF